MLKSSNKETKCFTATIFCVIFCSTFFLEYVSLGNVRQSFLAKSISEVNIAVNRSLSSHDSSTTIMEKNQSNFVVDILIVGTQLRPDLLQIQERIFATHGTVRNFFNVTEKDDADPFCHSNLTRREVLGISRFCRTQRYSTNNVVMNALRRYFAKSTYLEKKTNPAGWICAIPRPVYGMQKVMKHYRTTGQEFPSYLIMIDDDTYYDMDIFQQNFQNLDPLVPTVTAGCLYHMAKRINFTYGYGGFGFIFSRGSLERLTRAIQCPRDTDICNRISDNFVGEKNVFQNGTSVLGVMLRLASDQSYRRYRKWTYGYCLHGDWNLGYYINFYNLSKHDTNPYYSTVRHARMESYLGSEIIKKPTGHCFHDGGKCPNGAAVCHHISAENMERVFAEKQNKSNLMTMTIGS